MKYMQYCSILKKDKSRSQDMSIVYKLLWVISKTPTWSGNYTTKFFSFIHQKAHYCFKKPIFNQFFVLQQNQRKKLQLSKYLF